MNINMLFDYQTYVSLGSTESGNPVWPYMLIFAGLLVVFISQLVMFVLFVIYAVLFSIETVDYMVRFKNGEFDETAPDQTEPSPASAALCTENCIDAETAPVQTEPSPASDALCAENCADAESH